MNSSFINQSTFHLKISFLTRLFCFKFNEGILKRFTSLPIFDDFASSNNTKSREYNFQISFLSNRIQLADEQYILRRLHVCIRNISDHLKFDFPHLCNLLFGFINDFLFCFITFIQYSLLFMIFQSIIVTLLYGFGRLIKFTKIFRIIKGIINDNSVKNSVINIRQVRAINNNFIVKFI